MTVAMGVERRERLASLRTALYWLYDKHDTLLYVGIGFNPMLRWSAHQEERPWWHELAYVHVDWFPNRAEAEAAERVAIETKFPLYNVQHSTRDVAEQGSVEGVHRDPRTTQQRIAAKLRAQLMAGEPPTGTVIGTTKSLVASFGAANQTVQSALKILKSERRIANVPGYGIVAAAPPLMREAAVDLGAAELILEVGEVAAPYEVRQAFGLPDGGTAALRKRLLLLDDEPDELVWSYYPLALAQGTAILEPGRIRGGTPTLLAGMGFEPREMVDRVTVRPPTEEEFVLLELPAEVPVIRTFRVVYSNDEKPIEATVMVKAGHLHELLYRVPLH